MRPDTTADEPRSDILAAVHVDRRLPSVTLGLDLAAQPKRTAACAIRWSADTAQVLFCCVGRHDGAALDDEKLLDLMTATPPQPSKVAIDAPFGWPVDFVRAMTDRTVFADQLGQGRRLRLERRETDHWVHEHETKQPLSVTTDRIAYPAMRTAGLLAALEDRGTEVDRAGTSGLVCEVYPDPAIRRLGLWPSNAEARASYKGKDGSAVALRKSIVAGLPSALRRDDDIEARCIASDDALDALVCALVARAVMLEQTTPSPPELIGAAQTEGWIHVPRDAARLF